MKKWLEWNFSIFILILLSGCAQPQPVPVNPADAQKTVFQVVTSGKSSETATSYLALGSRPWFQGQIVAYWMCRPAAPNSPAASIFGYEIVRNYRGQGGNSLGGIEFEEALPTVDALIEFIADIQRQGSEKRSILFGRVLSPEVQALEVIYADEQRLRWPVIGKGFLLFRQEPVDWTELLVLGDGDQVLKAYDLTLGNPAHSEQDESLTRNCP